MYNARAGLRNAIDHKDPFAILPRFVSNDESSLRILCSAHTLQGGAFYGPDFIHTKD